MLAILFYIFAAITLAGAVGVVVARHIVHAAVQLLLTLLGVAGLYFLLDAEFLAAAQLVIYVGGTLVLIIFGVMLTSNLGTRLLHATKIESAVVAVAAVCLLSALGIAIRATHFASVPRVIEVDQSRQLGYSLLSDHLLAFEVASLLMLAVMIGAAYLARRRPKDEV
ncbi:MAG TPA: NADH-quinone oxidoreductase subunit J [Tepidisphaeraceae bacterium]